MVKHISHKQVSCPVARPLDVIGDGWLILVMRDVFEGLTRFDELQESSDLVGDILAACLHNLVEHGAMATVPTESSSHQEYRLTDEGRVFLPLLVATRQWGEDYFFVPNEFHVHLVKRNSDQPASCLRVHTDDGSPLAMEDTRVSRD